MLKIPSENILKPISYIKRRLGVVKFLQNQDSEKNQISYSLILVYFKYVKMVKNAKMICIAICFGSFNNLTGLVILLKFQYDIFYLLNGQSLQRCSSENLEFIKTV